MTKFHPYALLLGVVIGVMALFALRHPFALFIGLASTFALDYGFKSKNRLENDKDDHL